MSENHLQLEVIVFAGPNGSGKSTLVKKYELIHTIKNTSTQMILKEYLIARIYRQQKGRKNCARVL